MSHPRLLLVEGDDDAHAIRNLLGQHDISVAFLPKAGSSHVVAIKQVESVDDFPPAIRNELKVGPDLSVLGVVADADRSPESEWESVWNALFAHGECPPMPELKHDGWTGSVPTAEHDEIPAGVWIMPDNVSEGALEEFAMELIPDEDQLWGYSHEVIDGLPERRFDDKDEGKAQIHTWLAWQETPREPIGRALTQEVLNPEADLAERFVEWIRRLFSAKGEVLQQ
jgi:hypothetical protein